MAHDHPDAPKQFGIRLSQDTMDEVSAIQAFRARTYQPITLSAIVTDAINLYYYRLIELDAIAIDDTTTPRRTPLPDPDASA
jgi:hypothetical protein